MSKIRTFFCGALMLFILGAHQDQIAAELATTESEDAQRQESDGSKFTDYMEKYCLKFRQIPQQLIGIMIKDMENTPYKVDDYFLVPQCQPDGYSDAVKSPLLHIVADDPNAREKFLSNIFAYYSKKRKDPTPFIKALNAKNTKGETLLDYIESLRTNGINDSPEQMVVMSKIVQFACAHGASYSARSDKTCPKD